MSDISNKTILLLVLISVVISIAGIFSAPKGIIYITGLATSGTSSTSVNVTEEVSILVTNSIDFGTGRVNTNETSATLDSQVGRYSVSIPSSGAVNLPERVYVSLAFDSNRNVTVLFGGSNDTSTSFQVNETWEFNGTEWNNMTGIIAGAVPLRRHGYNMVYDSNRRVVVLHGGARSGPLVLYNDTWEYNGVNWTQINTASAPPLGTSFVSAMAFDNRRNITVLLANNGETWEYNSTNWNLISTSATPNMDWTSMVYDSKRNVIVLFGGQDGGADYSDTWEYNSTNWNNVTASAGTPPGARHLHATVFDSARNATIIIGGADANNGDVLYGDVWEYDGKWHPVYDINEYLKALGSWYPNGFVGAAAYDSLLAVTVAKLYYIAGIPDAGTYLYSAVPASGTTGGSWEFYKQFFDIENDGTVNISVNFSADKNASTFLGGTNPAFQLKGVARLGELTSCVGGTTTYTDILTAQQNVCQILKFGQSTDEFKVPVNLVIPNDAAPGEKSATITFSAAKA